VGLIAEKLALRFNQSISQTVNHLNADVIEDVSALLEGYTIIYVYGLGASHIVAEDFMQKFSRIGKTVIINLDYYLMNSLFINKIIPCIFFSLSYSNYKLY